MCGIIHVRRQIGMPAAKAVYKRFNKQRNRGTQGFGYVAVEDGRVTNVVKAESEHEIREKLMKETASEILFHHRFPTGGQPNLVGLAHPMAITHKSFDFDYLMVHNGVIANSDQLKKEHEELGFKYMTEYEVETETKTVTKVNGKVEDFEPVKVKREYGHNDSESLAYELALYLEGYQDKIGIRGGAAFIIYQLHKDDMTVHKMYYGSNQGRPLKLEMGGKKKKKKNGGDIIALKSEGSGKDIATDALYTVSYNDDGSLEVDVEDFEIGTYTTPRRQDFNSNPHNVHQPRMGFQHRDDERGDPPSEPSPSPIYGENAADIETVFPKSVDQDRDDETEEERMQREAAEWEHNQYDLEDRLVKQLEKEEALGLQKRADEVLEKIIVLEADVTEHKRVAVMNGLENDPVSNYELDEMLKDLKDLRDEFKILNDQLLEYNLPVPSEYRLPMPTS